MIVVNIRNPSDFTYTSNKTMRDRRLSAEARGVLGFMLTHSDKFEIDYKTLYDEFDIGKEKLLRILTELKKAGYLQITPKQGTKGKFAGWDWTVYGQSQEVDFTESAENGKTVKPKVGKTASRQNRKSENPPDNKERTSSDEERTTKQETHTNAGAKESYPLKELYEAFPAIELTPAHIGFILAAVTEADKAAWLATIEIYQRNHNPDRNYYLPEKVGNLLGVFKKQKIEVEKNAANGQNGRTKNGNGNYSPPDRKSDADALAELGI